MKKFNFYLACVTVFLLANAQTASSQDGIFWSQRIDVNQNVDGDDSPRMALLADGTPVALWGKSFQIYLSRMVDGSFTAPVQVPTGGISPDIYGFGGLDMATHGDDIFIVFENFTQGVYLVHSGDGGLTFEAPVSVYDPPAGQWATLASVATDEAGNPIVSVIRELTNETEARYVVMHSTDGGATFSPPVVASEQADGEYVCECCPSDLVAQDGKVWLIFRNNDNNIRDMWVSRSLDGGATFDAATDMDDTDWEVFACPISGPKMAPLAGDSLITAWMSGATGPGRVSFSTLHGGTMGKGWEMAFPQTNTDASQVRPDIAGRNDTIGVVWEETGFGANGTDLMFAFSKNGTEGLAANLANVTDASGAQRFPSLDYADGSFHLLYATGSGGLQYRRGTVSEVNANSEVAGENISVEVVPQPVTNGQLQLRFGQPVTGSFFLQMLAPDGRKVKNWTGLQPNADGSLSVELGTLAAGFYFLQIKTEDGRQWSVKVAVAH